MNYVVSNSVEEMDNYNNKIVSACSQKSLNNILRRTASSDTSLFVTYTYDDFAVSESHNVIVCNIFNRY